MKRFKLWVDVEAKDGVTSTLTKVGARVEKFGKRLSGIGRQISLAFTLPAVGIWTIGNRFDKAINRLAALTGEGEEAQASMRKLARELGRVTSFDAENVAQAMGNLAQAGFKANEILNATPVLLKAAGAAGLEFGQAANIVTSVASQFGIEVGDIAKVSDTLVFAATNSKSTVEALGGALAEIGPIARNAGMRLDEVIVLVSALAEGGVVNNKAGTALAMLSTRLGNITPRGANVLAKFGLTPKDFRDARGEVINLIDVVRKLEHLNLTNPDIQAIFGEEAARRVTPLLAKGSAYLDEQLARSRGGRSGSTDRQYEAITKDDHLERLKSAWTDVAIAIGESGFADQVARLIGQLARLGNWVSSLNPEILQWAANVFGAAAAMGPMIWGLGTLVQSLLSVGQGLKLAGAAISFVGSNLIGLLGALSGGILKVFMFSMNVIAGLLLKVGAVLFGSVIPAVWAFTVALLANPITWVIVAIAALVAAAWWMYENWEKVAGFFTDLWEGIKSVAFSVINGIVSKITWLISKLPKKIQSKLGFNAKVTGPERNIDEVAAATVGSQRESRARVEVDFRNAPPGMRVRPVENDGVDLGVEQGPALGTVYG